MLYISLPAIDKRVSVGAYVAAVKVAKANPDAEFKHGFSTWWPTDGRAILRQFRAGMNDRINSGISYRERAAGL